MLSHLQDPEVEAADVLVRDGEHYETITRREALEALTAAPPIEETPKFTRQSARRLAMQVAWAQLKQSRLPRWERRRLWHEIDFTKLARDLRLL